MSTLAPGQRYRNGDLLLEIVGRPYTNQTTGLDYVEVRILESDGFADVAGADARARYPVIVLDTQFDPEGAEADAAPAEAASPQEAEPEEPSSDEAEAPAETEETPAGTEEAPAEVEEAPAEEAPAEAEEAAPQADAPPEGD